MNNQSINFGELTQKIASTCFGELQTLLEGMPRRTPEGRYQVFKDHIALVKQRFSRLQTIFNFIKEAQVKAELKKVTSMEQSLDERFGKFDRTQDELYFLHRSLYGRRKRSLNAIIAEDILVKKTYGYLPMSIFAPIEPGISWERSVELLAAATNIELSKEPQIKYGYYTPTRAAVQTENVLFLVCEAPIDDKRVRTFSPSGETVLQYKSLVHFRALYESVADDRAKDNWNVNYKDYISLAVEKKSLYSNLDDLKMDLHSAIRAKLILHEEMPNSVVSKTLQDGFLILSTPNFCEVVLCLSYCSPESSWRVVSFKVLSKNSSEMSFSSFDTSYMFAESESRVLRSLQHLATTSVVNNAAVGSIDSSENCSSSKQLWNKENVLSKIWSVALHVSGMYVLRFLYVQAQQMSRSLWYGHMETLFQETPDKNSFLHRFWKIPTTE